MQKKIGENVSSKVGLTLKERGRKELALNLSLTHFNAHFDSYDTIRVNSGVLLPPPPPSGNHLHWRLGGLRFEASVLCQQMLACHVEYYTFFREKRVHQHDQ